MESALPGIIIIIVIIMVVKSIQKSKEDASKRPQNDAERGLVEDVIATIQRMAPDFDGARVGTSSINSTGRITGNGGITFKSLSGKSFEYDFVAHGYTVSYHMARVLAFEIVKRFGGECRDIYYDHRPVGCEVVSQRQLTAEQEKKRKEDSLKRL